MRAMLHYKKFVDLDLQLRATRLGRLSKETQRCLPSSSWRRLNDIQEAADENQYFFESLVNFQDYNFQIRDSDNPVTFHSSTPISASQMHRNQAVLHSLAREWSSEGKSEREDCFNPILSELRRHLPVTEENIFAQRVLVPGAGLCRLPVEIASLGYATQANEFSMFMLTASHFVLNALDESNCFTIFPWVDK